MALLETLSALRDADDPASTRLAWAWRSLSDHLDRRYRLEHRVHDDVRQRTLLKVMTAARAMEAGTEGRAEAWLRQVHKSAHMDHHRSRGGQLMDKALRATPKDDSATWLERVGPRTEAQDARPEDEGAAIDAAIEAVLDRAAVFVGETITQPKKRNASLLRAQVALMANIRGMDTPAIIAALDRDPPPSKAAVYKWVERGREQVLVPALEAWDHPIAATLSAHLEGCRRGDAGKTRPNRQKQPKNVSPGGAGPSTRSRGNRKKP